MQHLIKVLSIDEAANRARDARSDGIVIGLCHGCFDVLHSGHLRHFTAAAGMCDELIVSVTPDRFINKGPNRPVFPAEQRAELIAGLAVVKWVVINEWESAVRLVGALKPSIFFKGDEYERDANAVNPAFFAEKEAVVAYGGRVEFTHEWTSSSSAAIKRMR